jgi:outer membrane protease
VGVGGDGYMEDYDWIAPFATGTGPNDWSDRSQHDATDLDHFWGGSIALGYQLVDRDAFSLDLLGGAQYRDVKWSAYGGNYIYSYRSRHDSIGSWPDDQISISYRQKVPAAFAGFDFAWTSGRWTLSGSAQGGFTFAAQAIDDHWQRPLFFSEDVKTAPTVALSANIAYAISDRFNVNLGASYDQVFMARSNSTTYDPTTRRTYYDEELSGAGQRAFKLSAGLTGRF